jgi:formylglycine-generating enzyme required for sulfatase activity
LVVGVAFLLGGGGVQPPVPTTVASGTVTPAHADTLTPFGTSTPTPSATPTAIPTPSSTWLSDVPPPNASLGDTWTRPADDAVMVYVPAGEFEMGSTDNELDKALRICNASLENCQRTWFEDEQPVHNVTLHNFWIDHTEVTVKQFAAFVSTTGHQTTAELTGIGRVWKEATEGWQETDGANWRHPQGPGSSTQDIHPVVQVSWRDAQAYCTWIEGRLPTEAEWEYAARGPERKIYPWGNTFDGRYLNSCDINCLTDWKDNRYDDGYAMTAPVTSNPSGASWCGALEMAGNVWEWVLDRYSSYSVGTQINPVGPTTGGGVVRGGGWGSIPSSYRTAQRHKHAPDLSDDDIGFRCVIVPEE